MSQIKSAGTKPELAFSNLLEKNNINHIKHPAIYGKPDFQIGENVVIFVDGDFWHGWHFHKLKQRLPKNYWLSKIEGNIKRDEKKYRKLRNSGYKVIRIWEHELKDENKVLKKILKGLPTPSSEAKPYILPANIESQMLTPELS